jgi:hypothetical protein
MPEESNQNQQTVNAPDCNTWPGFLFSLITTKQGWLGIIVVTLIVTVICTAAALIVTKVIRTEDKIDTITGVGTISIKRGSTQNAVFLLSPNGEDENTPWVRTGIKVKKDDVITMTASGRVNTSIKRVVAETIKPEVEERTWVSPNGLDRSLDYIYFPSYKYNMILPDQKIAGGAHYGFGMLLAAVKDFNGKGIIEEKNIHPFIQNEIKFVAENDGELVLTVNDIWLSDDMENIYAPPFNKDNSKHYLQLAEFEAAFKGEDFKSWSEDTKTKKAKEQHQRRLKGWNSIVSRNNWNIWYDDNIGSFSVSITVNEKN